MKKIIVIFVIIGLLFIAGIIQTLKDKKAATAGTEPTAQLQKVENTPTTAEQPLNQTLNHELLLKISKDNPNSVIGKTYEMTLYLEQAPTHNQAEFMSQNDDGSVDTILVTCNMNSNDLNKLDGAAAQERDYKPYDLSVTFAKHESQAGLGSSYEAQCSLR